jgi:hypothetical protein
MMPQDDDQQPLKTTACSTKFLVLTCPIPPFSCGKEWNKHVQISYVVCNKSKTNMSEYSYQVQKSKKQMSEFSYWVQKSNTCVNFILGAKEQNM